MRLFLICRVEPFGRSCEKIKPLTARTQRTLRIRKTEGYQRLVIDRTKPSALVEPR